jgi:hypothetical protein
VWTTAHNLDIREETLYTSWYRGGVKRHDVSTPLTPVEESWWLAPDEASFWTAQAVRTGTNGFFVASSRGVDDSPGRLYTFPDRPGERTVSPSGGSGAEGVTTDRGTVSAESRVSAPGFGVGTTLGAIGLGVGGWWFRRRGGD